MPQNMLKNIKWLGHSGFAINAHDTIIVIDPFQIKEVVPADIILITHSHYDHCSIEDIDKTIKPDTVIVTEAESAKKLSGDVRVVKPGDKINVSGIDIETVEAYNTDKAFHPKINGWLGFIITIDGIRIYHAGDTDLIPEMDKFAVDIALLPVSGTYVMTAEEAVKAAKRLKPEIAIPMHFDSIVGSKEDAINFKKSLEGICEVVIISQ